MLHIRDRSGFNERRTRNAQERPREGQVKISLRYNNANTRSPQNENGNPVEILWASRRARGTYGCFFRAITYAVLFIGFVLVYVPASILSWSGINRPAAIGIQQVSGMVIGAAGALIALWCIFTFASVGRGTPAPFDPPRRLVIQGPYRFMRNPMYIGAGLALAGAAFFYESLPLLGYTGIFFLITHLFVILYEEPTLRRTFGQEYEAYCRQVRRWWPSLMASK